MSRAYVRNNEGLVGGRHTEGMPNTNIYMQHVNYESQCTLAIHIELVISVRAVVLVRRRPIQPIGRYKVLTPLRD